MFSSPCVVCVGCWDMVPSGLSAVRLADGDEPVELIDGPRLGEVAGRVREHALAGVVGAVRSDRQLHCPAFDRGLVDSGDHLDGPAAVGTSDRGLATRLESRQHVVELARVADRKSTRLNSSHANISYAVFCLKQK